MKSTYLCYATQGSLHQVIALSTMLARCKRVAGSSLISHPSTRHSQPTLRPCRSKLRRSSRSTWRSSDPPPHRGTTRRTRSPTWFAAMRRLSQLASVALCIVVATCGSVAGEHRISGVDTKSGEQDAPTTTTTALGQSDRGEDVFSSLSQPWHRQCCWLLLS